MIKINIIYHVLCYRWMKRYEFEMPIWISSLDETWWSTKCWWWKVWTAV